MSTIKERMLDSGMFVEVKLVTAGEVAVRDDVADVVIPWFQGKRPEVLVWGERVFRYDGDDRYVEAWAWYVPYGDGVPEEE